MSVEIHRPQVDFKPTSLMEPPAHSAPVDPLLDLNNLFGGEVIVSDPSQISSLDIQPLVDVHRLNFSAITIAKAVDNKPVETSKTNLSPEEQVSVTNFAFPMSDTGRVQVTPDGDEVYASSVYGSIQFATGNACTSDTLLSTDNSQPRYRNTSTISCERSLTEDELKNAAIDLQRTQLDWLDIETIINFLRGGITQGQISQSFSNNIPPENSQAIQNQSETTQVVRPPAETLFMFKLNSTGEVILPNGSTISKKELKQKISILGGDCWSDKDGATFAVFCPKSVSAEALNASTGLDLSRSMDTNPQDSGFGGQQAPSSNSESNTSKIDPSDPLGFKLPRSVTGRDGNQSAQDPLGFTISNGKSDIEKPSPDTPTTVDTSDSNGSIDLKNMALALGMAGTATAAMLGTLGVAAYLSNRRPDGGKTTSNTKARAGVGPQPEKNRDHSITHDDGYQREMSSSQPKYYGGGGGGGTYSRGVADSRRVEAWNGKYLDEMRRGTTKDGEYYWRDPDEPNVRYDMSGVPFFKDYKDYVDFTWKIMAAKYGSSKEQIETVRQAIYEMAEEADIKYGLKGGTLLRWTEGVLRNLGHIVATGGIAEGAGWGKKAVGRAMYDSGVPRSQVPPEHMEGWLLRYEEWKEAESPSNPMSYGGSALINEYYRMGVDLYD